MLAVSEDAAEYQNLGLQREIQALIDDDIGDQPLDRRGDRRTEFAGVTLFVRIQTHSTAHRFAAEAIKRALVSDRPLTKCEVAPFGSVHRMNRRRVAGTETRQD